MDLSRILVTPEGGHGTVFVWKRMRGKHKMLTRPDVIYGTDPKLDVHPERKHIRLWARRTTWKGQAVDLDLNKTIEENFVQLIEKHDGWILFSGRISVVQPFFTRNKIRAYGLLREPESALVSFLKHRHPNHAARFGGFNTPEAVEWWGQRWINIVTDLRDSDSLICDFTKFPAATGNQDLISSLNGWRPGMIHRGLSEANRALLLDLTQDTYEQLVQ